MQKPTGVKGDSSKDIKRKMNSTFDKSSKKIRGPDFNKAISRAHLDKIQADKKSVIPFSLPKHGGVWASKLDRLIK